MVITRLVHKNHLEDREGNPFNEHLAASLSSVVARRERHYSINLIGTPRSNLMLKNAKFCSTFFDNEFDEYGSIVQEVPTLSELKTNLISSDVYNDDPVSGCGGIGFYFSYQGKWSAEIIEEWEGVSKLFVTR